MLQSSRVRNTRNLYLLVLLVAVLTTLPWIGLGDYYTKGEPREASVSVSMMNDGNWILPRVYADEIPYKPPMTHWMIAVCSLPGGEVTPFTSRLPSTIAFVAMIGCCFGFFLRFAKKQEALVAVLILISCFELHRSSMTSRVDMLLTAFMVCGLICLYYWAEEKQLKGLPLHIPLLLGCAALVKGPVGVILPLFVFGIYLLFTRRKLITIVLKCLYVLLLALIPLFVWYYLAYWQAGEPFINLVWAENFGRFLGSDTPQLHYGLGHEHPFWYNFILLLSGFMPWTLFLLFLPFVVKYNSEESLREKWGRGIMKDRGRLFSLISACVIIVFYCIPMSKRGVYLMPAYPFIAIFLGQYICSVTNRYPKLNQGVAVLLGSLAGVLVVLSVSALLGIVDLQTLVSGFVEREKTLYHIALVGDVLSTPGLLYIVLLVCVVAAVIVQIIQCLGKRRIPLLYATMGVWMMCNAFLDAVILPAIKDGSSIKPFVQEIANKYPLKENGVYVMNNLHEYSNLYGANFYLHNQFLNFEKEQPKEGYFLSTAKDIEKVKMAHKEYAFSMLDESRHRYNDTGSVVQLYRFSLLSVE